MLDKSGDDVVGLITVQVISSIQSSLSISAVTVLRPIIVSFGFVIVIVIACRFCAKPLEFAVRSWLRKGFAKESVKWCQLQQS